MRTVPSATAISTGYGIISSWFERSGRGVHVLSITGDWFETHIIVGDDKLYRIFDPGHAGSISDPFCGVVNKRIRIRRLEDD